jgi:hypothetical protein
MGRVGCGKRKAANDDYGRFHIFRDTLIQLLQSDELEYKELTDQKAA